MRPILAAGLCAVTLTGCASASASTQSAASDVTQAIYNDDPSGVTSRVDGAIASHVTRASVGAISDEMHALGDFKGLDELSSDDVKHEYEYRANFTKGSMNVVVRVGSNGKLSAYRVFSNS